MIVNGAPQPFDAGLGAQAAETFQSLSAGGYRTLGVAVRKVDQQDIYTLATEHDMTLAGFAALLDPPKGGRFVLEALKQNGVSVVIITGDNQYVTQKVVRDVGLVSDIIVTETRSTRWTMPPWPTRRRKGNRCPRVSGAKEPGHPRSEGARARRWVGGRRHQRHSFATYR